MKRSYEKPKMNGGPLPYCMSYESEPGKGNWTDIVFSVVNNNAFELSELFVREDAEWDYIGGLTYKTRDEVNKNKDKIESFEPIRDVTISGKIHGKAVKITTVPTYNDSRWMRADYADGCPMDDFVKGLNL